MYDEAALVSVGFIAFINDAFVEIATHIRMLLFIVLLQAAQPRVGVATAFFEANEESILLDFDLAICYNCATWLLLLRSLRLLL